MKLRVFGNHSPLGLLRQGFSLSPEVTDLAELAGKLVLGIPWSQLLNTGIIFHVSSKDPKFNPRGHVARASATRPPHPPPSSDIASRTSENFYQFNLKNKNIYANVERHLIISSLSRNLSKEEPT